MNYTIYDFKDDRFNIDIQIINKFIPQSVLWIDGNSFVVVNDPENGNFLTDENTKVSVASVNGIGEVRWLVRFFDDTVSKILKRFNLSVKIEI